MAIALWSFKLDKDQKIRVAHVFFGDTDAEAEANLKAHADICPKFGPAFRNKETVEIPVEIDSRPLPDDAEEWLDEQFDLEADEDEEDDDVAGGPEDEEEEEK